MKVFVQGSEGIPSQFGELIDIVDGGARVKLADGREDYVAVSLISFTKQKMPRKLSRQKNPKRYGLKNGTRWEKIKDPDSGNSIYIVFNSKKDARAHVKQNKAPGGVYKGKTIKILEFPYADKEMLLITKRDSNPTFCQEEEYGEIPGMEGPILFAGGRCLYWDKSVGKYYDRKSDLYLTDAEIDAIYFPKSLEKRTESLFSAKRDSNPSLSDGMAIEYIEKELKENNITQLKKQVKSWEEKRDSPPENILNPKKWEAAYDSYAKLFKELVKIKRGDYPPNELKEQIIDSIYLLQDGNTKYGQIKYERLENPPKKKNQTTSSFWRINNPSADKIKIFGEEKFNCVFFPEELIISLVLLSSQPKTLQEKERLFKKIENTTLESYEMEDINQYFSIPTRAEDVGLSIHFDLSNNKWWIPLSLRKKPSSSTWRQSFRVHRVIKLLFARLMFFLELPWFINFKRNAYEERYKQTRLYEQNYKKYVKELLTLKPNDLLPAQYKFISLKSYQIKKEGISESVNTQIIYPEEKLIIENAWAVDFNKDFMKPKGLKLLNSLFSNNVLTARGKNSMLESYEQMIERADRAWDMEIVDNFYPMITQIYIPYLLKDKISRHKVLITSQSGKQDFFPADTVKFMYSNLNYTNIYYWSSIRALVFKQNDNFIGFILAHRDPVDIKYNVLPNAFPDLVTWVRDKKEKKETKKALTQSKEPEHTRAKFVEQEEKGKEFPIEEIPTDIRTKKDIKNYIENNIDRLVAIYANTGSAGQPDKEEAARLFIENQIKNNKPVLEKVSNLKLPEVIYPSNILLGSKTKDYRNTPGENRENYLDGYMTNIYSNGHFLIDLDFAKDKFRKKVQKKMFSYIAHIEKTQDTQSEIERKSLRIAENVKELISEQENSKEKYKNCTILGSTLPYRYKVVKKSQEDKNRTLELVNRGGVKEDPISYIVFLHEVIENERKKGGRTQSTPVNTSYLQMIINNVDFDNVYLNIDTIQFYKGNKIVALLMPVRNDGINAEITKYFIEFSRFLHTREFLVSHTEKENRYTKWQKVPSNTLFCLAEINDKRAKEEYNEALKVEKKIKDLREEQKEEEKTKKSFLPVKVKKKAEKETKAIKRDKIKRKKSQSPYDIVVSYIHKAFSYKP